ncbi:MAG: DUF1015 domain-containing protein, partial [Firmicutes bacterium]|nr:DUF1015 domain-containing protein [Bacillota bacterium]
NIRAFRGVRPTKDFTDDVYISHENSANQEKARELLLRNPYTLLHLTHNDLIMDTNDEDEIQKACHDVFDRLMRDGVLIQDDKPYLYAYRLSMANHSQTGLIASIDIKEYIDKKIKKHELTRSSKARLQVDILKRVGGIIEPILLAYDSAELPEHIVEEWTVSHDSIYDTLDIGGTRHEIWVIDDEEFLYKLKAAMDALSAFYICDGHHRIEAAAEYYLEATTEEEKENRRYTMAVIFPSDEMLILDYNRAVRDLNGISEEEFIGALKSHDFTIEGIGRDATYPTKLGEYTMVMNGIWYRLNYMGERNYADPVDALDVSILQEKVLQDILGIGDPQHDDRLSFISGTKGLHALEAATRDGMAVAFALVPPSMSEIMNVCNAGKTMPPKSTCFEPKPAGGLIVHRNETPI